MRIRAKSSAVRVSVFAVRSICWMLLRERPRVLWMLFRRSAARMSAALTPRAAIRSVSSQMRMAGWVP
jgi:hypothetical protein